MAPLRVEKTVKMVYNDKNKQERDLRTMQRLRSLRKNKLATLNLNLFLITKKTHMELTVILKIKLIAAQV